MVSTDTVVGIVGAVVLVAVMVGVFVYEYNMGAEVDNGNRNGLDPRFKSLSATEDIDGDGTPNAEDDDLDGDGTANADDTQTGTRFTFSGAGGNQVPGQQRTDEHNVTVGTGAQHVQGWVNYTLQLPAPVGPQFGLRVEVYHNGSLVHTAPMAPMAAGERAASHPFEVTTGLAPGNYTVRITPAQQAGPVPEYEGVVLVHYAMSTPLDDPVHEHEQAPAGRR